MHLYQKYRPSNYDEVVGNAAAIEALKGELEKGGAQVFLLYGPSGSGKTTLARIAANSLGAEVLEFNSANNRGIDTARDIQEQLRYASGPRAFIIDECHKTTNEWQNAMLKPLEDTPAGVYFFLCTTNPEKMLDALKTRCTKIQVSALNEDDMMLLLRRVNKAEGLGLDIDIMEAVIDTAGGSPRDALVIMSSVAAATPENRMSVARAGNTEEQSAETIEFCRALLADKPSWKTVAGIISKLPLDDPERVRYAVLGYMNAVLLKSGSSRAAIVMEAFEQPTYNTSKFGITLAAYRAVFAD